MKYRYWFASVLGIGSTRKKMLLELLGSCESIYKSSETTLINTGLLSRKQAGLIEAHRRAWKIDHKYTELLDCNIKLITYDDQAFPCKLNDIHDGPFALFYRGSLPEKSEKCIAMVGARRASLYGRTISEQIAGELAKAGYSVVSGMALGIDSASHAGTLAAGGKTYAFLGSGVDIVYPKNNQKLYHRIIENGAVISEYPPGMMPKKMNFPVRNRLISGISDRTLVMEAKLKSGSLITADLALEQGRDVYALPGRITDPLSEGTNQLISQGAGIITSAKALLKEFGDFDDLGSVQACLCNVPHLNLEKEELLVYSCFDFYPKGIDEVQSETEMDLMLVMSAVAKLEMRGLIREIFKNRYVRLV